MCVCVYVWVHLCVCVCERKSYIFHYQTLGQWMYSALYRFEKEFLYLNSSLFSFLPLLSLLFNHKVNTNKDFINLNHGTFLNVCLTLVKTVTINNNVH